MRDGRLRFLLLPLVAASLLMVSCSSTPAAAPAPATAAQTNARAKAEAPAASPEEAAAKLSGYWLVTVQRGGQSLDHSMHIGLTAGELVGSITGSDGNSREVSKITLRGDKVSWVIGGERMAQRFEGTLNGAAMEGKIKMARSSRGGSGSKGGQAPEGDDGGGTSASPPGEGQAPSGGGRGSGGRGGRGGRGGGGRGGSAAEATWKAFKSVEPPAEATPAPAKPAGDVGEVLAGGPARREGFSA